MLLPTPKLRENLSRTLWKWLLRLESPGGHDPHTNGEYCFLRQWAAFEKQRGQSPVVALDVGCNRGAYCAKLLETTSHAGVNLIVHAFEPASSTAAHLRERFAGQSNVILNEAAASDESGEQTIYFDTPLSEYASLHQRGDVHLGQSETIRTQRLDDYLTAQGVAHIHLLKLDVEGHELAALKGLGDKLSPDIIDFVQFEYGGANLDAGVSLRDLFSLLEGKGFALSRLLPRGLSPRRYKPWLETYQHGNFVAYNPKLSLPEA